MLHSCKTHGRKLCLRCFFFTTGFLTVHIVWEKFPVFSSITHALGL